MILQKIRQRSSVWFSNLFCQPKHAHMLYEFKINFKEYRRGFLHIYCMILYRKNKVFWLFLCVFLEILWNAENSDMHLAHGNFAISRKTSVQSGKPKNLQQLSLSKLNLFSRKLLPSSLKECITYKRILALFERLLRLVDTYQKIKMTLFNISFISTKTISSA